MPLGYQGMKMHSLRDDAQGVHYTFDTKASFEYSLQFLLIVYYAFLNFELQDSAYDAPRILFSSAHQWHVAICTVRPTLLYCLIYMILFAPWARMLQPFQLHMIRETSKAAPPAFPEPFELAAAIPMLLSHKRR